MHEVKIYYSEQLLTRNNYTLAGLIYSNKNTLNNSINYISVKLTIFSEFDITCNSEVVIML